MGAPRFFVSDRLPSPNVGTEVALPDDVAHHALRVLRLNVGDAITLFGGDGGEYAATITRAGKRDAWVTLDAHRAVDREASIAVTLVQALAASDAMDAIVRHAVELGVAALQPVITARSVRFPAGAHGDNRIAHWRSVVIAACEQCGRNRVPPVRDVVPLDAWLEGRAREIPGIVLDPDADRSLVSLPAPSTAIDLLVGPEGGPAPHELARALDAGLTGVKLGPRILRTETASLAALCAIHSLWGDHR